jgi:hypothetical protein
MPRPTGQWGFLQLFAISIYGVRMENGLWLKPDSAIPGAFDIQVAAGALYTAYVTPIQPMMHPNSAYLGARLTVANGTYTASADVNLQSSGTGAGDPLPPDDFIVVRMQGAVAGPNGKGRILIGGLDSHVNDNGRLSSSGVTEVGAVITALTAAQPAGGVSWNVQQYDHKNNVLHLPDFFSYNPVLGNLKRRSPIF